MRETVKNVLQLKIIPPPLRVEITSRAQILDRLDCDLDASGLGSQLVLVSAPAGFGKTMLVREWLKGRENRAAWYSLDRSDNEFGRFWIYLLSALQRVEKDVAKGTLEMLHSSAFLPETPAGKEELLTPLLNDLAGLESPLYLVLDDYHLVENTLIHEAMRFFIENLPPSLYLVLATRSEPPLPLARWRSKGRLVEIRHADLKFTEAETASFLENAAGRRLGKEEIRTLYEKSEGWVAALQLAAYSIRTHPEPGQFIENFTGNSRPVYYFLAEEVFSSQPPSTQEFLLDTSVLPRFCASLCNGVTGREDSGELLSRLENDNLLVFPLDEEGTWYRYHQLFADLLYHYLRRSTPAKIPALHGKASHWFLDAGEPGEAVRHAIWAGNDEKAAWILHGHIDRLWEHEGVEQLQKWLNGLPRALMEKYPRLLPYRTLISAVEGDPEGTRWCLEQAAELEGQGADREEEFRGMMAVARSYHHFLSGNLPEALESAEKALLLLPEGASFWRIFAAIAYGDVQTFSGDLESAYGAFLEAYRASKQRDSFFSSISAGMNLIKILWMKGELSEARTFAEEILTEAREKGFTSVPRVGAAWIFLGELLREEGKVEEAKRCAARGLSIAGSEKLLTTVGRLFQAMIYFSGGEYEEALQSLKQMEGMDRIPGLPDFFYGLAQAWKFRVLLEQGVPVGAREVMEQVDCDALETIFFHGNARLVLCRLLLAENRLEEARRVIDGLKDLPRYKKSRRLMIHTLLLETQLEERTGKAALAEECLEEALRTGAGAGFYQIFLDEGREAAAVYDRLLAGEEEETSPLQYPELRRYIVEISQKLGREGMPGEKTPDDKRAAAGRDAGPIQSEEAEEKGRHFQGLVEDLSAREMEVLALISRGLSNHEISQELFLSLGTVKWHTSNIYSKLGVSNRTHAVGRARELKILPPGH